MDMDSEDTKSQSTEQREERDDLINPFWIEDRDLGRGEVDHMSGVEISFWKDLIDKYLYPIDADKRREVSITEADFNCNVTQFLIFKSSATSPQGTDGTEEQVSLLLQRFQRLVCPDCVHVDSSQRHSTY